MLQIIRKYLELSQEELGFYLQLSPHMVQSVELGRRQLPAECEEAAAKLLTKIIYHDAATKNLPAHNQVRDAAAQTDRHLRHVKRLHRQCTRSLRQCNSKLEKMQASYKNACFQLGVYRLMIESLTPGGDESQLRWMQWKMGEAMQRLNDNDQATQDLLITKIAGLKVTVESIEASRFFSGEKPG